MAYTDFGGLLTFGQQELVDPVAFIGNSLLVFIRELILAALIIALGYAVSWALHWGVKKALDKAKVDKWLQKNRLDKSIGYASVSELGASLVKWYVFLIFLILATSHLALGQLTNLLLDLVRWLPHVIVAVAIVLFGLILADFISDRMSRAKGPAIKHLSSITKILVIVFIAVVALQEIGIYLRLAESTFLIVLTGATLAIALAVGIGFGLGFKDEAAQIVKQLRKKI